MKLVKWFVAGALCLWVAACERHPASQVPHSHGPVAHEGAEHSGSPAGTHTAAPGATQEVGVTPAPAATPVPQYFPQGH